MLIRALLLCLLALPAIAIPARAETLTVLSAGAFRAVVEALAPDFERATGDRLAITSDTAGGLQRRIEAGEAFDLAIITPPAIAALEKSGRVAPGSGRPLARVGIGVAVKAGAPLPDIATPDAFKATLLAARRVAMIDPKAGGSSGIYLAGLFERMGIAEQMRARALLLEGGYVAAKVASGEADLALHQISEILPVPGITLVGPLPADIQNVTTYAAGIAAASPRATLAARFLALATGPDGARVLAAKGMAPAN